MVRRLVLLSIIPILVIIFTQSAFASETIHIYGNNQRVASINQNGEVKYYQNDYLGSPRVTTNAAAGVLSLLDYFPFGEILRNDGHADNFKFTGKLLDLTSLQYFGARYYDADTGRFTQTDPIKSEDNVFSYAGNNPLAFLDTTGREKEKAQKHEAPQMIEKNYKSQSYSTINPATGSSRHYIGGAYQAPLQLFYLFADFHNDVTGANSQYSPLYTAIQNSRFNSYLAQSGVPVEPQIVPVFYTDWDQGHLPFASVHKQKITINEFNTVMDNIHTAQHLEDFYTYINPLIEFREDGYYLVQEGEVTKIPDEQVSQYINLPNQVVGYTSNDPDTGMYTQDATFVNVPVPTGPETGVIEPK